MRLALLLSALLVSGCHEASAPPAADTSAQNASKPNKEMSDLLRKADALAVADATKNPPPATPAPSVLPAQSVKPPAAVEDAQRASVAPFADRLGSLRRTAEAARLKKDRYEQVCQRQVLPECQVLTADVSEASKIIERELGDIQDAARRAGIDQGRMRDLLSKYGF